MKDATTKSKLDAYEVLSRDAERWLNQIQEIKKAIVYVEAQGASMISTQKLRSLVWDGERRFQYGGWSGLTGSSGEPRQGDGGAGDDRETETVLY